MSKPETVTITTNFWRIPSVGRAFENILEGCPSEKERQQIIDDAIAARAAWSPSVEALALVEQLKAFVGQRVRIQMWDSIMFILENEGPYPFECDLMGVILLQDGEHLQAYLEVTNVVEQPTPDGYSPLGFLVDRSESKNQLVPLSELYEVSRA
jgi:hypothetical protein